MFDTDKSYDIQFLGKKESLQKEPMEAKSIFRFKAAKRKYFDTVEHYNFGVSAIKYCDLRDKDSKNAYTKIFNDHDGFKVIATCIKIMHNLWKNDPKISFAFYASPRLVDLEKLNSSRKKTALTNEEYYEKYKRTRFNIYEHAMINLFPPKVFWKAKDWNNCIYVLLNKKRRKGASRLAQIGKYLLENHEIIFEVVGDSQVRIRNKQEIRIG